MNKKKFISDFPKLLKEFDIDKNDKNPEEISSGVHFKVWWRCSVNPDHKWEAYPSNRIGSNTRKPRGCPYCSGSLPTKTNNLKFNHPYLVSEWDYHKNLSLPEEHLPFTKTEVWWKCKNNHSYKKAIALRARVPNKNLCPTCSSIGFLRPEIAEVWDAEKNKGISPYEVPARTHKKYWFACKNHIDHSHRMTVANKFYRGGCPYCSGKKVNHTNSFATLYPEEAKEWHPTKNFKVKPTDVTAMSDFNAWWICQHGHVTQTAVKHRSKGYKCNLCTRSSSETEIRIMTEIFFLTEKISNRKKIDGVEIDIFLEDFNLAIEYDGSFFHKTRKDKDLEKNNHINVRGIKLIRVRDFPLEKLSSNDLIIRERMFCKNDMDELFKTIKMMIPELSFRIDEYLKFDDFINESLFKKYISYFPSPFPDESLEALHPELTAEWDYQKNFPLTPKNFKPGSTRKVWWACKVAEDHKWEANIGSRSQGRGCPYCSNQKVSITNSLPSLFPEVAKYWHPSKNGDLLPEQHTYGSAKQKIWWKCPVADDHEWQTTINSMTYSYSKTEIISCPYCRNKKPSSTNNLLHNFPKIASEWDYKRNEGKRPRDFLPGSNWSASWVCSKDKSHRWKTGINNRTYGGTDCPECHRLSKLKESP